MNNNQQKAIKRFFHMIFLFRLPVRSTHKKQRENLKLTKRFFGYQVKAGELSFLNSSKQCSDGGCSLTTGVFVS
jgi:hypothetical protein